MSEPDSFFAHHSHNPRQMRQEAAVKVLGAEGSTDHVPSSTSFALSPLFFPHKKRSTSVLQRLGSLSHCFG